MHVDVRDKVAGHGVPFGFVQGRLFDCVRLAPHFAQDDKLGKVAIVILLGPFRD
jgi:hypothetical protein